MMSTPEENFESAQFLISHADAELNEFEQMLQAWAGDGKAGAVVKEINPKTGLNELKVRANPVPFRMRGLASNIIKNIRDSLDQAVCGASHLITGKFSQFTHFPFGSSPEDFDKAITLNRCKGIPAELYPVLRTFEPFPTGDTYEGGNNMLRLLGRISGPHKHRVTLKVTARFSEQTIKAGSVIEFGDGGGMLFPPSSVDNETVFLALGEGGKANINLNAAFFVTFSHPKLRDIDATTFLREILATATKIVQDLQTEASAIGPRMAS